MSVLIAAALQRVLPIAHLGYFYLLKLRCLGDKLYKALHAAPRRVIINIATGRQSKEMLNILFSGRL